MKRIIEIQLANAMKGEDWNSAMLKPRAGYDREQVTSVDVQGESGRVPYTRPDSVPDVMADCGCWVRMVS